jgi:hypothetical protein
LSWLQLAQEPLSDSFQRRRRPTQRSARVADGGNAGCTQPWPYYERACLGDSRKRSSNAHAVRVIALANPGAPHTPQARR